MALYQLVSHAAPDASCLWMIERGWLWEFVRKWDIVPSTWFGFENCLFCRFCSYIIFYQFVMHDTCVYITDIDKVLNYKHGAHIKWICWFYLEHFPTYHITFVVFYLAYRIGDWYTWHVSVLGIFCMWMLTNFWCTSNSGEHGVKKFSH